MTGSAQKAKRSTASSNWSSEQVKGKSNIRLSALHANAEEEAVQLLNRATSELGAIESILTAVSPVVGVHAGPGTVALAYMTDI